MTIYGRCISEGIIYNEVEYDMHCHKINSIKLHGKDFTVCAVSNRRNMAKITYINAMRKDTLKNGC